MPPSPLVLLPLAAAALAGGSAVALWARGGTGRTFWSILAFLSVAAVWPLIEGLSWLRFPDPWPRWLSNAEIPPSLLIGTLFLELSDAVIDRPRPATRWLLWLGLALAVGLGLMSPSLFVSYHPTWWGVDDVIGPAFLPAFLLVVFLPAGVGLIRIAVRAWTTEGRRGSDLRVLTVVCTALITVAALFGLYIEPVFAGRMPDIAPMLPALSGVVLLRLFQRRHVLGLEPAETTSAVFHASADGLVVYGPYGGIQQANTSARRLLGLDDESPLAELQPALDDLIGSEADDTEGLRLVQVGPEGWFEVSTSVLGEPARPLGALLRLTDVSVRERARRQRRRLAERAEASQRLESIGTLAGGVAHDMNNVLASILGLAASLRADRALPAEVREDLKIIEEAAGRGRSLTRNLLGFARKGQYERQLLSVTDVAERTAELLARTLPKNVELVRDLEAAPRAVYGDSGLLGHALMNLFLNAVEAMGADGGTLTLRTVTAASIDGVDGGDELALPAGPVAVIELTDTGPGMDEATRRRVFEPFFTTREEGTGLGLAQVWGAAHQHHGVVSLSSKLGEGTRVRLVLPARPERVAAEAPAELTAPPPPAGARVALVVDDEPMVRRATVRLLGRQGWTTLEAAGGPEALDQVSGREHEVDVVVLDMSMPEMTGDQVFDALRARRADWPILLVSGRADERITQRIASQPHAGFLEKPFGLKDLGEAVDRVVGGPASPGDEPVARA